MVSLSLLEQAPARAGVPMSQSLRDAIGYAEHAEALGYRRFWIAEHHAIGSVVSLAPEVLIGHVAAATQRIRVGSGGMLLPNHRPLHVAEQFRTLEALHPGRIDLGVGRSEGATDPATVLAFNRPGDSAHGAGYEQQLDQLLAVGGVRPLAADHPLSSVRAMPRDVALPPIFMLGSTENSARAAARRGLGYGFAAYTNPDVVAVALQTYRREFVPARPGDRPHAILGLKVMVGDDDAHGEALALPAHLAMVRHRAGTPGPLMPVESALAHRWTAGERAAESEVDVRTDAIGGPERVRRRIEELVEATSADEVIATMNTFEPADRYASARRLAAAFGLQAEHHGAPALTGAAPIGG